MMRAHDQPLPAHPRIAVAGAGIAGLTCAYRLQQQGCAVQLYEARPRVGGRLFTVMVDGQPAELGGHNLCDGGDAVHLCRLADELRLPLRRQQISLHPFYCDGSRLIPFEQLLQPFLQRHGAGLRDYLAALRRQAATMRQVLDGLLPAHDPLYKALSARLEAYEGGDVDSLSTRYTDTLYHILNGGLAAAHPASGQANAGLSFLTVEGGNALLPLALARQLDGRVHLHKALQRLQRCDADAYRLTFSDGTTTTADIVVLALPCPVYRNIAFAEDVIPPTKLDAIRAVRYGTNGKIFLPNEGGPTAAPSLIFDKAVAFSGANPRLLTLYLNGPQARFDAAGAAAALDAHAVGIAMAYGHSILSGASPTVARQQPLACYRGAVAYSWTADPYAGGSYHYIAAGQEQRLAATALVGAEKVKTLFAPLQGRLFFAGEHTSLLDEVPGTVEAACESGERCARLVLQQARDLMTR